MQMGKGSLVLFGGIGTFICYKIYTTKKYKKEISSLRIPHGLGWKPKDRINRIQDLKTNEFDILIIGGGASGAGCALDATTRGMNVALIEMGDFGSGTSSKSTKLIHGGIRYLEKAVKSFSMQHLKLVLESLRERASIMHISPYLTKLLPTMVPVYSYWSFPQLYSGLVLYDLLSGFKSLGRSYLMTKESTINEFPLINKKELKGSIVYYDAQQNDARNNLMIALTSAYYGATISNYVEVLNLIEDKNIVIGAKCKDKINGDIFEIKAKGVINTTGPFTDKTRSLNRKETPIMIHSSGAHIVLPKEYSPNKMALIDTHTSDNRVLFTIPWKGKSIVGSTDNKCALVKDACPNENDINFILENLGECLNSKSKISRDKVLSAWSGIRPLVKDSSAKNTEEVTRKHVILIDDNKLLTLTGGKWSIYRKMAEDTIDKAVRIFNLTPKRQCVTKHVQILGSNGYNKDFYKIVMGKLGIGEELATHLVEQYGAFALKFGEFKSNQRYKKLTRKYEYVYEEIDYAVKYEMATSTSDIVTRRMGLGFIDVKEAGKQVAAISTRLRKLFNWKGKATAKDKVKAFRYLDTLGL